MVVLATLALALAALTAGLFILNLAIFRRTARIVSHPEACSSVSVLIPARNEAATIGDAVTSALAAATPGHRIEVIVLDDHSTDDTAAIVRQRATQDSRVRLVMGHELPPGWCGKQHACWQLGQMARHDLLLFVDADVRLQPHAVTRLAAHLDRRPHVHLLSGVPRQLTGSVAEHLLIPLIHFVLLGYLPLIAARMLRWSAFAAGCGQLFLARRTSYLDAGGHRAVRATLHDGIQLPRAFRTRGFQTDLTDVTDLADCRMYRGAREVWNGLAKNATEAMASPAAIVPWTVLLLGGHVLPWILLALALSLPSLGIPVALTASACVLSLLPRVLGAWRFRQSWFGAWAHPAGVLLLVLIQWYALGRRLQGKPSVWRGRAYPTSPVPGTLPPPRRAVAPSPSGSRA